MSAESFIVRDHDRLRSYVRERYEVECDIPILGGKPSHTESSAKPLIHITNRLLERRAFKCGYPAESDDFEPFLLEAKQLHLGAFARSKIFRSQLLPKPIDITAARVSVTTYSNAF